MNTINPIDKRKELQLYAVNNLVLNPVTVLRWATGVGKSLAAIECQKAMRQRLGREAKTLILVGEVLHRSNWQREYHKYEASDLLNNTEIVCYASIEALSGNHYDLIIMDEGHHCTTPARLKALSCISYDRILILSATISNDAIYSIARHLKVDNLCVMDYPLHRAIEDKILPKPRILIYKHVLDGKNPCMEMRMSWRKGKGKKIACKCSWEEFWKYAKNKDKYPVVSLKVSCTPAQLYSYYSNSVSYWSDKYSRTLSDLARNKMLQAGLNRKTVMGEGKTQVVKEILKRIPDLRTVCFCVSISQANALGKKGEILHSKVKNAQEVLNNFNQKKINRLFVVGMLQEGHNLTDVQLGIMIQLDSSLGRFIQKMGRSLRSSNPTVLIINCPCTYDEDLLREVLVHVPREEISYLENIEEL